MRVGAVPVSGSRSGKRGAAYACHSMHMILHHKTLGLQETLHTSLHRTAEDCNLLAVAAPIDIERGTCPMRPAFGLDHPL